METHAAEWEDAPTSTITPMRSGIGPHLSEQASDSHVLLTVSNLDFDGCATDTDSEKETLHKTDCPQLKYGWYSPNCVIADG
ncbi:hypothetical protein BGZ96_006310 [Linnemannia gamsii]|uniref:Uncharacterized protein n=1 Tax=Linnemannia gamsii TaxID=64522 RepID=A0ABQ7K2I7_9FUNG|nr:hypothetical protein BGZ96_006310 [Linnemannia gamsii]